MQEEVNEKVISLGIRTAKLTADVLAGAMKKFLDAQEKRPGQFAKGRQTLKQLMEQNAGAVNIEIDDGNIRFFDRVARKYHIDYAVKKDRAADPPRYFVFFKGRDQDAMAMAFREFVSENRKKSRRPSFKEVLKKFQGISMEKDHQREKTRSRDRGQSL